MRFTRDENRKMKEALKLYCFPANKLKGAANYITIRDVHRKILRNCPFLNTKHNQECPYFSELFNQYLSGLIIKSVRDPDSDYFLLGLECVTPTITDEKTGRRRKEGRYFYPQNPQEWGTIKRLQRNDIRQRQKKLVIRQQQTENYLVGLGYDIDDIKQISHSV